jgi:hypothetical protein
MLPSAADSRERIQMDVNASQIKEEVRLQLQQDYPALKARTPQGELRNPLRAAWRENRP